MVNNIVNLVLLLMVRLLQWQVWKKLLAEDMKPINRNKREQTWENEKIPNSEVLQEFPEEYLEKKMPSLNFEPAVFD